jgi:four helix bundle protein
MLHFQKLDVYQRSIELLALAHRVRERLPKGHADLADQSRRAAQSVPQNIAEGCGRTTRADKAKHYTIARGSAMESASHLDVMRVDELIDTELYARGIELLERIVAMLTRLIDPGSSTASITITTSFPFTSAATITETITATATATATVVPHRRRDR